MPSRILRDGILTSSRVNKLDDGAELFYRRLMSIVDDFGRFLANPTHLRVAMTPLRVSRYTDDQVAEWIKQCSRHDLIEVYTVGDFEYLEIKRFNQRIRRSNQKSKYPPPPPPRGQTAAAAPPSGGQRAATAPPPRGQTAANAPPSGRHAAPGDGVGDGCVYAETETDADAYTESSGNKDTTKTTSTVENSEIELPDRPAFQELIGLFIALGRGVTAKDLQTCEDTWRRLTFEARLKAHRYAKENLSEWQTRPTNKIAQPWNYLGEEHWERAAPRILKQSKPASKKTEALDRATERFMAGK